MMHFTMEVDECTSRYSINMIPIVHEERRNLKIVSQWLLVVSLQQY